MRLHVEVAHPAARDSHCLLPNFPDTGNGFSLNELLRARALANHAMIMFRRSGREIKRLTRELTLLNEHGLHARPATEFVRCVQMFKSTMAISVRGKRYRADRIMEVLLADLSRGDTFVLEAEGPDAREAVERISELMAFLKEAEDRAQNFRNPHREVID